MRGVNLKHVAYRHPFSHHDQQHAVSLFNLQGNLSVLMEMQGPSAINKKMSHF